MDKKEIIRLIYLYLFTTVGLMLMVIGAARFIDLGLRIYVFSKADQPYFYPEYPKLKTATGEEITELTPEQEEKYKQERIKAEEINQQSQRQRTAASSLAMLIVGAPLFFYHWNKIQRERKHS